MNFLDKTGLRRLWEHILVKLDKKVDKEEGKGLSTNDFTSEEKEKLASLGEKETFIVYMPNEETLSHSFAEILAAHKENKLVFAKLYGYILAPLTYISEDETYLVFSQLSQETIEDNSWLWMDGLTVRSDDTFTTNFKDILSTESNEIVSLSGTWNIPQAISELTERVQELSEVGFAKADWDESDPENPSYVQNRTHWTEFVHKVPIDGQFGIANNSTSLNTYPMFNSFSDGAEVIVTIDDTIYETTAYKGGKDWFFIGNGELAETSGGDTSIPFGIYVNSEERNYIRFSMEVPGFYHLKIECFKKEIHKISKDYLPENPQPDWNQNDETALDYIKNRTHYKSIDKIELVSNYSPDGSQYISLYDEDLFSKLTANAKCIVTLNGVEYEAVAQHFTFNAYDWYIIGNGILLGEGGDFDETLPFGIFIDEYNENWGEATEVITSLAIEAITEKIVKIPEEYLPASIGKEGTAEFSEIFNDLTNNIASNAYSHAENFKTTASGYASHAEGLNTVASGYGAHVEGNSSQATSAYSHAEGWGTMTTGIASYSSGVGTIAAGEGQSAIGKYNISNSTDLFIVGTGTSESARKNGFTVGTNGVWVADTIKIGGTGFSGAEAVEVATKEDVQAIALETLDSICGMTIED